jgi:hypothetical protein
MSNLWIVSRNATGRPTLCHAISSSSDALTLCGVYVAGWSRHYLVAPLPYVTCKRCQAATDIGSLPASGSVIRLVSRTGT